MRRLLDGQAPEESQFDDAALYWIQACQFIECIIQPKQIDWLPFYQFTGVVEGEVPNASTTLSRVPRPRIIHEHLSHQLCGQAEKLCAILPMYRSTLNHAKIGFVNESRAL